jgi:hypothetical protein
MIRPMRMGILRASTLASMAAAALAACGGTTPANDDNSSTESAGLTLDCGDAQPMGTSLDSPGPGRATPELAVEPYADGAELVAQTATNREAVVYAVREGRVVREFNTTKRSDGWWPDGWLECSRG